MAKNEKKPELSQEELEEQQAEELPDREAMSLVPIPGDDLGTIHTLPVQPPHETLPVEPPEEA